MDASDWTIKDKPYDLRERLFNFACVITRLTAFLHTRGPIADSIIGECAELSRIVGAVIRNSKPM